VSIREQQSDGRLGSAKVLATSLYADEVKVADWDHDGLADIFVAHGARMALYRQATPGVLEPEVLGVPQTSVLHGPQRFALGDLNSDGYPDFVTISDNEILDPGLHFGYNVNGSHQRGPQEWVKNTSIPDFAATSHKTFTDVRLTMQRALNPSSVTGQTVKLLDGLTGASVAVTVKYDAATKTITIYRAGSRLRGVSDTVPLTRPGYPYRVVIGGVKDAGGDTFGGYSFTFTG
jgi:FG-GAP-like repeat/Bacterial Ig-like domain